MFLNPNHHPLAYINENSYHYSILENKKQALTGKAVGIAARDHIPLPTRVSSRALLGEARELLIEHKGRDYRLRITRQGNLILTA